MAEKRMFAKTLVESDAFLDMPLSTQALYFHLGMFADDDGVVNSPRRIQRTIGATDDDLRILIAKKFLIPFDSGVVVIKHWKLNNYIRSDRYKPSVYISELSTLTLKDNGSYTTGDDGIPVGIPSPSQNRVDKNRVDEVKSVSSIVALMTEEMWDKLDKHLSAGDIVSVIDHIDERVDVNTIKNPYNYIMKTASSLGYI